MYLIHDNGSLPFLVNIDGRRVEIFDNPLDNPVTPPLHKSVVNPEKLEPIGDPVKSYNAKKIFIGQVPATYVEYGSFFSQLLDSLLGRKRKIERRSKEYMERKAGNTILLKIRGGKYIFIERCIYQFGPINEDIIDYISPIERNDVPYPVAYGQEYIYFLFDSRKVHRSLIPEDLLEKEKVWELLDIYFSRPYPSLRLENWKCLHEGWRAASQK